MLGSKCLSCAELFFPPKAPGIRCPHCYGLEMKEVELGGAGTLAAFTTVMQPPAGGYYRGPVPFSYGLVDLDEGVRVEALLGGDAAQYRVGMRVRLVIETLYENEDGAEVQVFRFRPAEEQETVGGAA